MHCSILKFMKILMIIQSSKTKERSCEQRTSVILKLLIFYGHGSKSQKVAKFLRQLIKEFSALQGNRANISRVPSSTVFIAQYIPMG